MAAAVRAGRRTGAALLLTAVALFAVHLGLYRHLVGAVNRQELLTGVEASSSFRDPISS